MSKNDLKEVVIAEKPDLTFKAKNGEIIRILSEENENFLEEKAEEMLAFMRDNHSQSHDEETKDKLYQELIEMWSNVSGKKGKMNEVSFNLILYREEYNYLLNLLKNKLEYDADTIFYGLELEDMIKKMVEEDRFETDEQAKGFIMTAVDVHYLYHLLSKHTVKGLTKQSYLFAEIIKRIALSSNIFNHYKSRYDALQKAISMWVASLDKGFVINEDDPVYILIWSDSDIKPVWEKAEKKEDDDKVLEKVEE
jgi:hypothetical protein